MTAFEEIVYETAKHLASIGVDAPDLVLEQRYAISIIQARAAECRHLSGGLLTSAIELAGSPGSGAMAQAMQQLSRDLTERSHRLEQLGMDWAQQWPPEDKPAPKKLVLIKE